jgi:hypothetical protein
MIRKMMLALAGIAGLAVAAPAAAQAQVYYRPVYVAYAPPVASRDYVRGRVTYFNRFNMTVRVDGRDIPVVLHQGTIIHPTGLTLQGGMYVGINGYWGGGGFQADRIVLIGG